MELLIKISGKDLATLPEDSSSIFFDMLKGISEEIDARTLLSTSATAPAPTPEKSKKIRAKKEESAPQPEAPALKTPAPVTPTEPPQVETPAPQPEAPAPQTPVAEKKYSLGELQVACKPLMDNGRLQDIALIVKDLGAESLTILPADKYGAFAERIREMGAKI